MHAQMLLSPVAVTQIANAILLILVCVAPILSIFALLQLRRQHIEAIPLVLWVIVILFVPILGALAYFIMSHNHGGMSSIV